jgi:hypothetical protein
MYLPSRIVATTLRSVTELQSMDLIRASLAYVVAFFVFSRGSEGVECRFGNTCVPQPLESAGNKKLGRGNAVLQRGANQCAN